MLAREDGRPEIEWAPLRRRSEAADCRLTEREGVVDLEVGDPKLSM